MVFLLAFFRENPNLNMVLLAFVALCGVRGGYWVSTMF